MGLVKNLEPRTDKAIPVYLRPTSSKGHSIREVRLQNFPEGGGTRFQNSLEAVSRDSVAGRV